MHIALIHDRFTSAGGMERYLFDLIRGFHQVGHQITVIAGKTESPQPLADKCKVIRRRSLFADLFSSKTTRKAQFNSLVQQTLSKNNFDLTITLTDVSDCDLAICGGTHKAYLRNLKMTPSSIDTAHIVAESSTYKSAKVVIAHSPMLHDELRDLYDIPDAQIETILPPVDVTRFVALSNEARKLARRDFALAENVTAALFISTGHHRKGIQPLLKAFAELPAEEYQLLIAGAPLDGLTVPKSVRYMGYMLKPEELYQAVDCAVLPSYYEPFGLVVPEALACGTPVIVSEQVGAKILVNETNGVILSEINAEEIIKAMCAIRSKAETLQANIPAKLRMTTETHIKDLLQCIARISQTSQLAS